jgi:F0F1-type ATP synthase membrane subunit b/b'
MNNLLFILTLAALLAATASFIWMALKVSGGQKDERNYSDAAEEDVEHIFNDKFREELRNRGRLHFENIIGENAMFLQQDLRLTTSQLNEYMKSEITKSLKEAFAKYEESISDAKQLAVESIEKTRSAIDEQRTVMNEQLAQEIAAEKQRLMERFGENMAEIVNHYVLAAVGSQLDLNDQLEYIVGHLESNKQDLIEDLKNGA